MRSKTYCTVYVAAMMVGAVYVTLVLRTVLRTTIMMNGGRGVRVQSQQAAKINE
jgi:hypothetical protein